MSVFVRALVCMFVCVEGERKIFVDSFKLATSDSGQYVIRNFHEGLPQ